MQPLSRTGDQPGRTLGRGDRPISLLNLTSLARQLEEASSVSGRSLLALALEITRLRASIGRIGVSEYLDFRLYENDLTLAEKRAFGGWRAQAVLEEILVDDYSRFLSLDKITMYALLKACGFPIPELRAVYGTIRPARNSPHRISSRASSILPRPRVPARLHEAVARRIWPRKHACARASRRVSGSWVREHRFGEGVLRVTTRRARTRLDPAGTVDAPSADRGAVWRKDLGRPGPYVSHARRAREPSRAIWKINVGTEDSDNFRHGASGNMLGAFDLDTGRVTRVVSGKGLCSGSESDASAVGDETGRVPRAPLERRQVTRVRGAQGVPRVSLPGVGRRHLRRRSEDPGGEFLRRHRSLAACLTTRIPGFGFSRPDA